jgi:TolA-binding protein
MRLGRFALLAGFVAVLAVTALAWARTRRVGAPELPVSAGAAAPPAAAQPAVAVQPVIAAQPPVAAAQAVAAQPPPAAARPAHTPSPNAPPRSEAQAAARVDALVQAGDIGRARDAAEDFLRRYPSSSYCQHIETLTGVHPRPPIPGE